MTTIRAAAGDYLAIRRSLGFKLGTQGRVLMDFVAYLEHKGTEAVTTQVAVEWATRPSGTSPLWHAARLGVARRFAAHLQLLDPGCEVPPPDLLPERHRRLPPHLFSADDRPAAIRSFFRFASYRHPEHAASIRQVLAIPQKRTVHLGTGAHLKCLGKGRKRRDTPLDKPTVKLLHAWMHEQDGNPEDPLFPSRRGARLSPGWLAGRRSTPSPAATDPTTRSWPSSKPSDNAGYTGAIHGPAPPRAGHSPGPGTQRGITGCAAEKAQVTDNDDGIVLDYGVEYGAAPDGPQLVPAVGRVARRTGRVPRAVTADRGYGQAAVERDLRELGVKTVAIPRQAATSAARKTIEHSRGFRRLVRWRTGCEGRISYLKRGYGWDRTLLDGRNGAAIWCGHGVFAHNLVKISALAA